MTRSHHAASMLVAVILSLCLSTLGQAAVPSSLNYQGYLADAIGMPTDGDVTVIFNIYNVPASGVPLWSQTQTIQVVNGLFSVELGGTANSFPPGLFDDPVWLGVQVEGDPEMAPRRPLTSVGFSFKAEAADNLGSHSSGELISSICEIYSLTNNAGLRPNLCGDCFAVTDCGDGNECTTESCDDPGTAGATCSSVDVADGTPCDFGAGECIAGSCIAISGCTPPDCNDGLDCTIDNCDVNVCTHDLNPATCLIDDTCYNDGQDGEPCLYCDSAMNPVDWSFRPAGWPCPGGACDLSGTCIPD